MDGTVVAKKTLDETKAKIGAWAAPIVLWARAHGPELCSSSYPVNS